MEERERLAELARRAGAGDEEAFSGLFEATHQRVYYLARQILRDDAEAMDVTQETFLKAWKALPKLEHPEAVVTWLFRIADNLCRDRQRRSAEVLLEDGDSLPEQEETDELLLPQELMDRSETRRLVREMIEALPTAQKECILLYYFAGLSVGEIAAQQDCSEGTVKSRLNYGRRQIKSAVLELEKREGTKLYTMAPLPLLLAFLREVPAGALPGPEAFQAAWASVARSAGLASAAGTGSASAPGVQAAGAAGKAAGTALGTKIAAGVVAVALVGGGAAGIFALTRDKTPAPPPLELAVRPVSGGVIEGRTYSPDILIYNPSTDDYRLHEGVDLAAGEGETVVAAQSGFVEFVYYWQQNGDIGNGVYIDHGNGMCTEYASLSSIAPVAGTYVQAGDAIGTAGTYNIESQEGPHVHFEVWVNKRSVDPMEYLPE